MPVVTFEVREESPFADEVADKGLMEPLELMVVRTICRAWSLSDDEVNTRWEFVANSDIQTPPLLVRVEFSIGPWGVEPFGRKLDPDVDIPLLERAIKRYLNRTPYLRSIAPEVWIKPILYGKWSKVTRRKRTK
jgi:hypothetical protein